VPTPSAVEPFHTGTSTGTTPSASSTSASPSPTTATRLGGADTVVDPYAWSRVTGSAPGSAEAIGAFSVVSGVLPAQPAASPVTVTKPNLRAVRRLSSSSIDPATLRSRVKEGSPYPEPSA
jgi:hypothetical protein